jgi:phosphate acyltransferase
MGRDICIALDVMGGDHGPPVVVPAAAIALERRPDVRYLMFGFPDPIAAELAKHPRLRQRAEVRPCEVAIKMTDKPSQALRAGRRASSMWRAIDAVKQGEADCAVSSGNTGALMAMAKFCLHMLPMIDRPALAGMWPTLRGDSIVLDLGASIGADSKHLVDLAIMGAAMARVLFDIERPSVGLINVGVEEIKGIEEVKAAGRALKETDIPHLIYHGFVEGDDLGRGTVDVFVTEGFTGNILLKTAEGTAKQIAQYMRQAMNHSFLTRLGAWLARDGFNALRLKMDPGRTNGAVLLGLDGVVIKSHGGSDAESFAGAIEVGYDMVRQELLAKIREMIGQTSEAPAPAQAASP